MRTQRTFGTSGSLTAILAAAVLLLPAPSAAQARSAMGVSVTVAPAAPVATLRQSDRTYATTPSGATEMRSVLTVGSASAYSLRLRNSDGSPASRDAVLVRMADGTFAPIQSAMIASAQVSSQPRDLDLVLRLAPSAARSTVTAELLSAPLDQ